MAAVLSQSEIEALLTAMTTVEEGPETELPAGADPVTASGGTAMHMTEAKVILPLHKRRRAQAELSLGGRFGGAQSMTAYEAYDFRRPDKLSKDHLRSLQMLHETFSNHLSSSLGAYLRSQVQIDVVSVEQVPYDEYIRSISASLLNILDVNPLQGQAIFEIDFGILFSMIDRLLGGSGAAGKIVRDLTDIEKVLAENIVDLALSDMKTSWENINPLTFDLASMESSPQFVQIVPGNDTVVLILMEIVMGEHRGAMSLCIPYLLIKPILGRLSAQRWLTSAKKPSALHAAGLAQRLNTTRVPCVARLGTANFSVAELVNLQVGQVLPMQVAEETASDGKGRIGMVDLLVGGQVKFRGRTGLRGKNLAVQIEEVLGPATELVSHKEVL